MLHIGQAQPLQKTPDSSASTLLNIREVARILGCSARHVYRLVDTKRIPQPVKLGALLRWVKTDIDKWIAAGCPDCRKGGTR